MNELALEGLRRDHASVRAVARQLRMVAADLRPEHDRAARSVLDSLLEACVRRLFRHMRQEEHTVYPQLTQALGSDVPVRALIADHNNIRAQVADLQTLNSGSRVRDRFSDPIPALRTGAARLASELELHIRREEAAFGAIGGGRDPRPGPSPLVTSSTHTIG